MAGYDRSQLPAEVTGPGSGTDGNGRNDAGGSFAGAQAGAGAGGSGGNSTGRAGEGGSGGSTAMSMQDECAKLADGAPCDDGLTCTVSDRCTSGHCTGTPMVCPPPLFGMEVNNDCRERRCVEPDGCSDVAVPALTRCGLPGGVQNYCVSTICTEMTECDDSACAECDDQTCYFTCADATRCQPRCSRYEIGETTSDVSLCHVECAGAQRCDPTCTDGSWCDIDCRGAERCGGTCRDAQTTCVVDCRDTQCSDVVCETGATCSLLCAPGASCKFLRCAEGEMTCGENRVGCGGCPE